LLKYTEFGTHLPGIGKINTENKTYTDCYIFWQKVRLFNITNSYIEQSDFPIMLNKGKIMNDEDLYKEIFNLGREQADIIKNTEYTLESCNIINKDTTLKIKEILKEALNQEFGLLIPHNACVEIPDDFIFKYARFIESEDFITIFYMILKIGTLQKCLLREKRILDIGYIMNTIYRSINLMKALVICT